jgi:hypothetical protein
VSLDTIVLIPRYPHSRASDRRIIMLTSVVELRNIVVSNNVHRPWELAVKGEPLILEVFARIVADELAVHAEDVQRGHPAGWNRLAVEREALVSDYLAVSGQIAVVGIHRSENVIGIAEVAGID